MALHAPKTDKILLTLALVITSLVYWAGLTGPFIFDDYPNIVENKAVQPRDAHLSSLVEAALSSPSSEFKRPLASLSFAANYLATGLNPYWMKLTNLLIHLVNGWLFFLIARALILLVEKPHRSEQGRAGTVAALITAGWMLLPINLTAVLYVVQRMESLANVFVLLGILGYLIGRRKMLGIDAAFSPISPSQGLKGFLFCAISITAPALLGVLAKETAVMLPLYALLIEWIVFDLAKSAPTAWKGGANYEKTQKKDPAILILFAVILVLPLIFGALWIMPSILRPESWATRDFSLRTRLFSEARIVMDYIDWTLLPEPDNLSFYHDDFRISTGAFDPWTTFASMVAIAALVISIFVFRRKSPLVALGIALFLGCHLLTATVLPLELVYEHRNYFASFGLLLAFAPPLLAYSTRSNVKQTPFLLARRVLFFGLIFLWASETFFSSLSWSNPLSLAVELAERAPNSPRAQYELGRTYIVFSKYDPASPFTKLAYAPLERAATLKNSSILPEQALIFMNSRMHLPIKETWWAAMISTLKIRNPSVQDESSLGALTTCARQNLCDLPKEPMTQAFLAALSHPKPTARLQATYADYAWNVLDDHSLGEQMASAAVKSDPNEPVYRITLTKMLVVQRQKPEAAEQIRQLERLNYGGRINSEIEDLRDRLNGS